MTVPESRSAGLQLYVMVAISATICIGLLVYKSRDPNPIYQYLRLLASYEFGLIKRALIGELFTLSGATLAPFHAFWLGVASWVTALTLFLVAFRRIFGLSHETLLLFVFMACSPFFFKNFAFANGYLDIYGCIVALIALLLAPNLVSLLVVGLLAIVLLFIHHLHLLLYIPTILIIVGLRYYARWGPDPRFVVCGAIICLALLAVSIRLIFFGTPPVTLEVFTEALRRRDPNFSDPQFMVAVEQLWYLTLSERIHNTPNVLPRQAKRLPVYVALVLIHYPLIACYIQTIRNLATRELRVLTTLAAIAISAAYPLIFISMHDYSRVLSDWAVCRIVPVPVEIGAAGAIG
jgi:hypothetical protein